MAIDGTYNITLNTPMGAQPASLTLKAEGGALSGSFIREGNEQAFEGGTANGDDIAWTASITTPMGPMDLGFSGKVDGDSIAGDVQFGAMGAGTWTGDRA